MNNYQYSQMSRTLGTIAVLGGMLALPAVSTGSEVASPKMGASFYRSYRTAAIANTYDQHANIITGEFSVSTSTPDLEKTVGALYERLLANQEPLGSVFEDVLQASLWNLYEA